MVVTGWYVSCKNRGTYGMLTSPLCVVISTCHGAGLRVGGVDSSTVWVEHQSVLLVSDSWSDIIIFSRLILTLEDCTIGYDADQD